MHYSSYSELWNLEPLIRPYQNMHKKYILLDVDGVCLDWEHGFMKFYGHKTGHSPEIFEDDYDLSKRLGISREEANELVTEFNNSIYMESLSPLRNSAKWIPEIYRTFGMKFIFITSMSLKEKSLGRRYRNLANVFGKELIEDVITLDTGASKTAILEHFKDTECIWVEDKPSNYEMGQFMGLDSYLMKHDYNSDWHEAAEADGALINSWRDIFNRLWIGSEY